MTKLILFILGIIILITCDMNDDNSIKGVCDFKTEILSPIGFELNSISELEFNGSVQAFQFIDEKIGFVMLSNNVGGYVEALKTIDGGQSWSNLDLGFSQSPISMIFKDENFGIITVHDITGCPPPNCQNKCVVLKTENGGLDWVEVEYEELKGILYHPKYDSDGNLYSNLVFENQSTLMKSVDDGKNWEIFFSSDELGFAFVTFSFEIFNDKIFISAKNGKILVIDPNGQLIKVIEVSNSSIYDLEIIDEDNLIVVLSGKVVKSTNGGDSWSTIYGESARMLGFESANSGLMLLHKSICPGDVYQVNDVIGSTNNGGVSWNEAERTTTNMRLNFVNSQRMGEGIWYVIIENQVIRIREK